MIPKTQKTSEIEKLRSRIQKYPFVQETDEAEASLCALSLQSQTHPERHIWIDTDMDEISIGMDLEDWQLDDDIDDAVARVSVDSLDEAVEIISVWFSGAELSDWYTNVNQDYQPMQPKKIIQLERKVAWQLLNQCNLRSHQEPALAN